MQYQVPLEDLFTSKNFDGRTAEDYFEQMSLDD